MNDMNDLHCDSCGEYIPYRLTDVDVVYTPCVHVFHLGCFLRDVIESGRDEECPVCRAANNGIMKALTEFYPRQIESRVAEHMSGEYVYDNGDCGYYRDNITESMLNMGLTLYMAGQIGYAQVRRHRDRRSRRIVRPRNKPGCTRAPDVADVWQRAYCRKLADRLTSLGPVDEGKYDARDDACWEREEEARRVARRAERDGGDDDEREYVPPSDFAKIEIPCFPKKCQLPM